MSSFPFISHHLFVSAVAPRRQIADRARREESAPGGVETSADDEQGHLPENLGLWASITGGTPFDVPGGETT